MNNLKKAFGIRLKELRKSKKYTQETLAEKIDLSPRQLIRIENGNNFPSSTTVEKICSALNIGLDYLFDFRNNEDIVHSSFATYIKPTIQVLKSGDLVSLKTLNKTDKFDQLENTILKNRDYEEIILNFCKKNNVSITAEIFENETKTEVKTFTTKNTTEIILNKDDIIKNDIFNHIVAKLKKIADSSKKLNFTELALDSLEDKAAFEKLKIIMEGMELLL